MLFPRIIPCLLISNKGLVKTVNFRQPKYVGDPINAVRIFNEKEVDEIMVIDIDATKQKREPDYNLIEHLAAECRMPLCYGGGVSTSAQVERIVQLGVEKVAISSAAIKHPELVSQSSARVGNQSVVVVLDIRRSITKGDYEVWTHNASINTGRHAADLASEMEKKGAGEIVINSIDKDGLMTGYDYDVVDRIRKTVSVPVTALGGAGSFSDFEGLIQKFGCIGAAAGSLFVFKGIYKAVLISYPSRIAKDKLIRSCVENA